MRLVRERLLEREQLGELPRGRLPHGLGIAEVAMLLEQRDAQPGLPRDDTARRLHVACDQLEERRLSRAVPADDPPPLARGDRERDVGEERCGTEFHRDVGERELRHAVLTQPLHSVSAQPDTQPVLLPHERHLEHQRLVDEQLEPAVIGHARVAQPAIDKALRALIDKRAHPELLRKPAQLTERCGALREIDEVRLHAPLREKAQCLARLRILFYSENLNVHTEINARGTAFPSVVRDPLVALVMPARAYRPAWWIPGAHLRTLWGKFMRPRPALATRRERWGTNDDDFLDLHRLNGPAGAPRLLILHGLEGTVRSHYAGGLLHEAQRRGWAADLLIFRSCGDEPNRALRFYHSGETSDLDAVVRRLVADDPARPLLLVGVSLGGNVLLKWLGEQGDHAPEQLRGAAAVSVPFDLGRGARHLDRGFSRFYQAHFLRSLRQKAIGKSTRFPAPFAPTPCCAPVPCTTSMMR